MNIEAAGVGKGPPANLFRFYDPKREEKKAFYPIFDAIFSLFHFYYLFSQRLITN